MKNVFVLGAVLAVCVEAMPQNETTPTEYPKIKELQERFWKNQDSIKILEDNTIINLAQTLNDIPEKYGNPFNHPYQIRKEGQIYAPNKVYANVTSPVWIPLVRHLTQSMFGEEHDSFHEGFEKFLVDKGSKTEGEGDILAYQGKCVKHIPNVCYSYMYKTQDSKGAVLRNLIYDIKKEKVLGIQDIFNEETLNQLGIPKDSFPYIDLAFNGERLVYGMNNATPKWQKIVETKDALTMFTEDFKQIMLRSDSVVAVKKKIVQLKRDNIRIMNEMSDLTGKDLKEMSKSLNENVQAMKPTDSSDEIYTEDDGVELPEFKNERGRNIPYYISKTTPNEVPCILEEPILGKILSFEEPHPFSSIVKYLTNNLINTPYTSKDNKTLWIPEENSFFYMSLLAMRYYLPEGFNKMNYTISFVIEPDGTTSEITVEEIELSHESCLYSDTPKIYQKAQKEALDTVEEMIHKLRKSRGWIPGKKDGKAVRTRIKANRWGLESIL